MATKKAQPVLTMRDWALLACHNLGGKRQRSEIIDEIKRMRRSAGLSTNPINPPFSQMRDDGLFRKNSGWGYWQLTQKGTLLAEKTSRNKATKLKDIKPLERKKASPARKGSLSPHEHKLAVEEKAIKFILKQEKDWKRTDKNNPGFDLYKGKSKKQATAWCEVKSHGGEAGNMVQLTNRQFQTAKQHRNRFWLYIVDNVADGNKIRIREKIQDPFSNVDWQ